MDNNTNFVKIIHHIWFNFNDDSKMPTEDVYNSIKYNILNLNPKYEYKLWNLDDAKELIDSKYPFFSKFFKAPVKYNIIKCDFFRYLLMYHYGGIYLDLDFVSLKSFDNFFIDLIQNRVNTINNNNTSNIYTHEIILTEEWYDSYNFTNTLHNGFLISKSKKN